MELFALGDSERIEYARSVKVNAGESLTLLPGDADYEMLAVTAGKGALITESGHVPLLAGEVHRSERSESICIEAEPESEIMAEIFGIVRS